MFRIQKHIANEGTYHTRLSIERVYGFKINLNTSAHKNVVAILDKEPSNILKCKNRNLQFHNLCPPSQQLPVGIKSLLGNGLKFCIEQPRPYQDVCTALIQFKRSLQVCDHLVREKKEDPNDTEPKDNSDFNRRLYI